MKKSILALFLVFGLAGWCMANDWATTGVGGSKGTLTPEQAEAAWTGLAEYKTFPAVNPEGKSAADLKKANDEIGAKNDQKALLAMEWVVINSINDPKTRPQVAARLAKLAADPNVSYESKVFICAMLFRIGTPAEVPAIAPLLDDPKTADAARLFLERVPSEEATVALRKALDKLTGKRESIGVMNSLSVKKDAASVGKFIELTKSSDAAIALAAWRAISNIANAETADFLAGFLKNSKKANGPAEAAAIRVAIFLDQADQAKAAALFNLLGDDCRTKAGRQASANWQYKNQDAAGQKALLAQWMKSDDPAKLSVVIREISQLDDKTLEGFTNNKETSESLRLHLLETLALRQGEKMLPVMLENMKTSDPAKVRVASRFLTRFSDDRIGPAFIAALGSKNAEIRRLAGSAILEMPKEAIASQLVEALNDKPALRDEIVPLLSKYKYYEAINPLIKLAQNPDPKVYEGAIEGLRGICDPDDADLGRMFTLYLQSRSEKQREFVARAITYIAEKNSDANARAKLLLAIADKSDNKSAEYQAVVLPLLGRFGTSVVFQRIEAARKSTDPAVAAAAVRALCNWPTAEHAAELWTIAETSDVPYFKNQALRAYIRVVSLPSKRAETETLDMLKKSMKLADNASTRNLALARSASVRTLETVKWAAEYLDTPELAETASKVIVELAHHRFLRQPNKAFFEPILRKVEKTSKDGTTVQKAEKARMGM
ncbi:MAG: hypothetical protein Q4G69_06620 [Planctomycetia bacterium]|nr:hypothetical protein [Planctomycetia bacterium]